MMCVFFIFYVCGVGSVGGVCVFFFFVEVGNWEGCMDGDGVCVCVCDKRSLMWLRAHLS